MSGIVVGVDGSAGSQKALRAAMREAVAHGESLRVVCAYNADARQPDHARRANVELQRDAEAVIEASLEAVDVRASDVDVISEAIAVRGENAAQALINASKGASMLVVGSRGLDGFMGLLVGSVGQQCVQYAACPVLVVPMDDDRRG